MPIHAIYKDFFRFLEAIDSLDEDLWELYNRRYFQPHRVFFKAYWSAFFPQLDLGTLQDRVRQVRRGHYDTLRQLAGQGELEKIVLDALSRCGENLPGLPEPEIYLLVGFFSADGFILDLDDRPVIGLGLERYRDFRLLDIILAHEYCHYARRLTLGLCERTDPETLGQKLLAEGLSVVFSRRVYPKRKLEDHLLMSRHRMSWCRRNEARLESLIGGEMDSSRLVSVMFGRGDPEAGIPPRAGMYLGYRLVERILESREEEGFEEFLNAPDITSVLSKDKHRSALG